MRRSRVQLVPESQAQGAAEHVFAEVKQTLGTSFVPEVVRGYASIPAFLEVMWRMVAPALSTRDFLQMSDRLRAQAYTEAFNYFGIPEINGPADVASTIDSFHCAAPRILLLTSIILRALEEPIGSRRDADAMPLPVCRSGAVVPQESQVPAAAREVLDDARVARSTTLVSCWMLALSRWPEFLRKYWNALKPLTSSAVYDRIVLELRETAFAFADDVPIAVDLTHERLADAGLASDQIAEIGRITNIFALEYGPMVLDVEIARIGCQRASCHEASAPQVAA